MQDVCQRMFIKLPTPLRDIRCDQIGDKAGPLMLNMGATILHKLTHWEKLTLSTAGVTVGDVAHDAGKCQTLAKEYEEDASKPNPVANADSYMWRVR
jgi:hypothetical protein